MPESLIKKLWKYPVLRPQVPTLIESQRKKYFALRDKSEAERKKYIEMIAEYNQLLLLEEVQFSPANDEQAEGRLNRDNGKV